MLDSVKSRTIIVAILLVILLSLFIWYGSLSPAPEKDRFPGNDELVEDYDKYKGEKVEVGGEVIKTDPMMIEVESGDRTIELEITDLQERPDKGDRLTVFGTAGENNTVYSENALIRPSWRFVYMYGISIIAAVWIGLRLVGHWRFYRENLSFESRERPLTILETLSHIRGSDRDG